MKRKILWLASWYPNKHEPLSGDFIERHAKAASLLNDITVIHVMKDDAATASRNSSVHKIKYPDCPSLTAITGYYTSPEGGAFAAVISLVKYFKLQRQLIKAFIKENGKPDIINVHISFKAGLGALYCKWRYGINYIVSEHWTIFCPEAKPSVNDEPLATREVIKKIFNNANRGSAVSQYLAHSLANKFSIQHPIRIPNVVDEKLFFHSTQKHSGFTFIHISVLNYQKCPDEIIEAVALLKTKTLKPFQLIIYGPHINAVAEKINTLQLEDIIQYRKEVKQPELATEVRKCHSLLLYSRFETFGCVVAEALVSGLPVIVSDIPVMHELVEEEINGIFAPLNDTDKLAEKMLWMMENYENFNQVEISRAATAQYNFQRVAEHFDKLYSA